MDISIFFAGDFCSKPSTNSITVSEELAEQIQSCDFKVVNFEVPLKSCDTVLPPQRRERFFQNDDAPGFLKGMGFNLFSLANNHAFDWGDEGFRKTKEAFGGESFGAGSYEEAYRVKVVEKDGVKIGFLALSFAAYTGVFDDVMAHEGLGCAYINDLRVNHDIIEAKKQVDYLFVLPHDGIEYIDVPMPETIARYRDFIDYGADGVIGTHPHCPQGWEEYKGKPIFYSLGNFFFNSKETTDFKCDKPHWYEGLCVIMQLEENTIKWRIVNTRNIDNVQIVVDSDECRNTHNDTLNKYLKDRDLYSEYLNLQCTKLTRNQEMPIIDRVFHGHPLKTSVRLVKKWLLNRNNDNVRDEFSLITLLRNDSRCYLLRRGMKQSI